MRNKDLKDREIGGFKNTQNAQAETLVLEDSSGSYRMLLENYYNELKAGIVAIPEDNEISEFINELIWFNNLEINGDTIH